MTPDVLKVLASDVQRVVGPRESTQRNEYSRLDAARDLLHPLALVRELQLAAEANDWLASGREVEAKAGARDVAGRSARPLGETVGRYATAQGTSEAIHLHVRTEPAAAGGLMPKASARPQLGLLSSSPASAAERSRSSS